MRQTLERFLGHLRGLRAPRTIDTYKAILLALFAFLESRGVSGPPTRADVEAFLARPRRDGGRRAVTARNQATAALRVFFRWALREGVVASNPTDGIPFLREPDRDPAVLSAFEVRRLFADVAARDVRHRARNLAILALLSQLGLRVHELVALDMFQIDRPSATLIGVRGKNDSMHDLPLNEKTIALVDAWLGDRVSMTAEDEHALFISGRGRRLSVRDVQRLLEKLRVRIGSAKKITPHTLRHSAATLALTMGVDLATVGELLRHQSLNTTRKYLHLVDVRRREAVNKLAVTIPSDLAPATASTTPTSSNTRPDTPREAIRRGKAGGAGGLDVDGHFGDVNVAADRAA